jgi:hypothetical protein
MAPTTIMAMLQQSTNVDMEQPNRRPMRQPWNRLCRVHSVYLMLNERRGPIIFWNGLLKADLDVGFELRGLIDDVIEERLGEPRKIDSTSLKLKSG